jgi:hypothetical protein
LFLALSVGACDGKEWRMEEIFDTSGKLVQEKNSTLSLNQVYYVYIPQEEYHGNSAVGGSDSLQLGSNILGVHLWKDDPIVLYHMFVC